MSLRALLVGEYKLIRVYETGALSLFDITKDPAERHGLADQMPDKVKALNQRLTDYLLAVNAQMPRANPNYDPARPMETKRGGKRKAKP
jgi:arylsulfatase A